MRNVRFHVSPTKLELSEAINIYDIIFSGFQAAGDAICCILVPERP
jgi:hypothetical protein